MTTQLPDPANTQIDPATGLPLVNPNKDLPALNPTVPDVASAPVANADVNPAAPAAPQAPDNTAPTPVEPITPQINASTPAPQIPKLPQSNNQEYIVKPGDSVNAIAQRLGVSPSSITGYRSGNPNKIAVGETLQVAKSPTTPSTVITPPLNQNTTAQTGDTTPVTETGKTPFQNVMDTYTQAYQELGLGNLKTKYADILKQTDDIQKELNSKINDVNNNPWLSSASRSDEIDKLKEKYTPRLDLATHQAQLIQALQQEGEQTAQFLVGHVETDTQAAIDTAQKKQDAIDKLAAQDIHPDTINGRAVLVDYKTQKIIADLGPSGNGTGASDILSVADAQSLGVPFGTTKTQAIAAGITPQKPVTDAQAQASGQLTRATTANDTISSLENTVASMGGVNFSYQKTIEGNAVTNGLASDEIKQLLQAERNFATAQLRRESGAAISQGEFDTFNKQYFPQPGDDATTLANKAQARADVIAGLTTSSGSAATKSNPPTTNPSVFYDPKTKVTYVLGKDGTYNPQ